jgi:DNA-binding transcriptional LysR family regulator
MDCLLPSPEDSKDLAPAARGFPGGLREMKFLLRAPSNPARKALERFLAANRITPRVALETDDVDAIRLLALHGAGAAALDESSVHTELARKMLVKLHSQPIDVWEEDWLVMPRRPRSEKGIDEVADFFWKSYSQREVELRDRGDAN